VYINCGDFVLLLSFIGTWKRI